MIQCCYSYKNKIILYTVLILFLLKIINKKLKIKKLKKISKIEFFILKSFKNARSLSLTN